MYDQSAGAASGQSPQRPIYTTNVGPVVASVWEKMGERGPMHSVKIQKIYTDKGGKTAYGDSFSIGDLGAMMMIIIDVSNFRRMRQAELQRNGQRGNSGRQQGDQPAGANQSGQSRNPNVNPDGSYGGYGSGEYFPN